MTMTRAFLLDWQSLIRVGIREVGGEKLETARIDANPSLWAGTPPSSHTDQGVFLAF